MSSYSVPIELNSYRRLKDRSVTFKVDSRFEIPSAQMSSIDASMGNLGVLMVSEVQDHSLSDDELQALLESTPKYDSEFKKKSPSKKYRDLLWRCQEKVLGRAPTKEEFADYYDRAYEKQCKPLYDFLDSDI